MDITKINNYTNFLKFKDEKPINSNNIIFSDFLYNALNKVNEAQIQSDEYKKSLALGELDNLHELSIASEKANISLQIAMSIRNKIVEAYKEIMRIQI